MPTARKRKPKPTAPTIPADAVIAFKCVRPNGTDFRTGTVDYVAALVSGAPVELLGAAPATGSVCGHGLHVSPTARKTIQFANRDHRPWRWLAGYVRPEDIVEKDEEKMRVRRFTPIREIGLTDIFGPDFARRIDAVKVEAGSWKAIPWLKPTEAPTREAVETLVAEWRAAITPWLRHKEYALPTGVKIVETKSAADAADAADAAAAAAAVDAAANAAAAFPFWLRWYVRPRYVLWRFARWQLAGMTEPNPWEPLVKLYRLGAMPIGFVRGEFVVYCPKAKGVAP